jgi:hypothetical protein
MRSITNVAEAFFAACETGKRREACSAYCKANATFCAQSELLLEGQREATGVRLPAVFHKSLNPRPEKMRRNRWKAQKFSRQGARSPRPQSKQTGSRSRSLRGAQSKLLRLGISAGGCRFFSHLPRGKTRLWIQDPGDTLCPSASVLSRLTLDNRPRSLGGRGWRA